MSYSDIETALRSGDFSAKSNLRELMLATCMNSDAPAPRLFALVAVHADVAVFEEAMKLVRSPEAIRRLVASLGLTLSPAAIPMLWKFRDRFDDHELDPYIADAIQNIIAPADADEVDLGDGGARAEFDAAAARLNSRSYYYHGGLAFAGEMTKDLVSAVWRAYGNHMPLGLVHEGELITAFSGLEPPVARGDRIDDDKMRALHAYVQRIAAMKWRRGAKYFCGHLVDAAE